MARFIPLVLNNSVAADGEKASILAAYSLEPGYPEVSLYAAPQPYRTSRLKTVLLWQIEAMKFGVMLIVRSPLGPNALLATSLGHPTAAPVITFTPFGEEYDSDRNHAVSWVDSQDPDEATPVDWPVTGDIGAAAPGFFSTFNGKPIPNWAFAITNSDAGEGDPSQILISIDFSHSIT